MKIVVKAEMQVVDSFARINGNMQMWGLRGAGGGRVRNL